MPTISSRILVLISWRFLALLLPILLFQVALLTWVGLIEAECRQQAQTCYVSDTPLDFHFSLCVLYNKYKKIVASQKKKTKTMNVYIKHIVFPTPHRVQSIITYQ